MEKLVKLPQNATKWFGNHPKARISIGAVTSLLLLRELYKRYRYSILEFDPSTTDLSKIGILITGCDTGFGNAVAKKLNKLGYCVIATCYSSKSVSQFNNDTSFTKHGSFAIEMDVTKIESIENVKNQVVKWLGDPLSSNKILWSIINNAGMTYPGNFEIVPSKIAMYEYNVLFFGVLNVTRIFLPILKNRRNKNYNKFSSKTNADGGRIINVSSVVSNFYGSGLVRYGVSKAAVKYFSNCLRCEYAPLFGIWSCSIHPGFFKTNIIEASTNIHGQTVLNHYYKQIDENGNGILKDDSQLSANDKEIAITFKIDKYFQNMKDSWAKWDSLWDPDLTPVINSIIHGVTAKYPKETYFGITLGS